jgi:hypothetical protein
VFDTIEELNLYLAKKDELTQEDFILLIEKNETLFDGENMQEVKRHYEKTDFKNFGYFFGDFLENFEGCFYP